MRFGLLLDTAMNHRPKEAPSPPAERSALAPGCARPGPGVRRGSVVRGGARLRPLSRSDQRQTTARGSQPLAAAELVRQARGQRCRSAACAAAAVLIIDACSVPISGL
jgi:hypothetical protein